MSANSKASPHVNGDGFDPASVLNPSRALTPVVTRVNERIVASGFWPKLRRAVARVPFAADALAVWYCARDSETPATAKAMIMAALAYFILPLDAVPDFLPVIGYTDDAAVIAAVVAIVSQNLKPWHRAAAKAALERVAGEG